MGILALVTSEHVALADEPHAGETPEPTPGTAPAPVPPRSRRPLWISLGVVAFVVAVAAIVLLMSNASSTRYDAALERYGVVAIEAQAELERLRQAEADATSTHDIAAGVLAVAADGYTDATAKADVALLADELATTLAAEPDLVGTVIIEEPRPGPRPSWYAELDSEADRLSAAAERVSESSAAFEARADALDAAAERLVASEATYLNTIPGTAAAIDAANGSARNADRIELRKAIELVTAVAGSTWNNDTIGRVERYVAAAAAVQASHAAEEAEKAGPLYDRRVAVEAFARSIAGGVLLEFDWAPEVIGYGLNGSYAGTATWNAYDGGFSSISLTNSVAELWPDEGVTALVVHEVGHAIVSKCTDIILPVTPEDNEAWATAWAIGMGYTSTDNGEAVYGRPSDELIEKSKACR